MIPSRTYDLVSLHDTAVTPGDGGWPVTGGLVLPDKGSRLVTGILKLAQAWTTEFLTEQGSMLYQPERGSTFLTALKQGYIRTTVDAEQEFLFAAAQVADTLQADESERPADERLASAELVRLEITAQRLALWVRLLSEAGEDRDIHLPVAYE